jgi:hypothetical protein
MEIVLKYMETFQHAFLVSTLALLFGGGYHGEQDVSLYCSFQSREKNVSFWSILKLKHEAQLNNISTRSPYRMSETLHILYKDQPVKAV